jgi:soluble cytochrome b562
MKKLAYLMLLIIFSNMLLVSATDSNTSNYSKEIEKIDKEINEITLKLKELESKNPDDEKIQEYKQRLKELIEKRHELKSQNPEYNETLAYIQSEEYQKMQEEIWEYNNKVMQWFIAVSVLILGVILVTLWVLRKDKFLLVLAVFGLIVPFLQFKIPNWLFNILALPLFVYVKFIVPNDAGGSFYHSPFMTILISMYGWVLIGLVVKFIIKRLK